ncbi:MAG: deoxyguanosinetriphosphate triphosphohydrolase, partial [Pseudomonadota bacterium]
SASNLEEKRQIRMTDAVLDALIALRDFLYETVYERPMIRGEFEKAQRIISELWAYFHAHPDEFRAHHWPKGIPESDGLSRAVGDFITGMTDRYALRVYEEYFLPRRWEVY